MRLVGKCSKLVSYYKIKIEQVAKKNTKNETVIYVICILGRIVHDCYQKVIP